MASLKYGFDISVGSAGVALGALVVGGILGYYVGRGSVAGSAAQAASVRQVKQTRRTPSYQMAAIIAEAL
jgi:hypothetical protein